LDNDVGIAVLVLTHTREMDADDPIDTISGTLGIAGCADTSAILARRAPRSTSGSVGGLGVTVRCSGIYFCTYLL